LDNEISHSEKLIVEKHIQECASCKQELRLYQQCAADLYEQLTPHRMEHDLKQYVMEHLPELDYSAQDVAGLNKRAKHPSIWRERVMRLMPVGVAGILVVLAYLISEQWPTDDVWDDQVVGVVSGVVGDVVRVTDAGLNENDANLRQFSSKGDQLETSDESYAVVTLKGGTDITLNENSALTFQDDRQVRVGSGQYFFDVTPSSNLFRVLTPFGDITVFGTQFNVLVDTDSVRVDVIEGVVRFEKDEMFKQLSKGDSVEVRDATVHLQSRHVPSIRQRSQWARNIEPDSRVKTSFLSKYEPLIDGGEVSGDGGFMLREVNYRPIHSIELKWNEPLNSASSLAAYHVYVSTTNDEEIFHRFIQPSEFKNAANGRLVLKNNGNLKQSAKTILVTIVPDKSHGQEEINFSGCKPIYNLY
jgi:hypothetical protein